MSPPIAVAWLIWNTTVDVGSIEFPALLALYDHPRMTVQDLISFDQVTPCRAALGRHLALQTVTETSYNRDRASRTESKK
jgi:hypothetical protein